MDTFVRKEFWEESFAGWIITGCVIRDRNIFYFSLRQDLPYDQIKSMWDSDINSRLVAIYLYRPENPYSWKELEHFNQSIVGVSRKPIPQGLLVSCGMADSPVCVMGKGKWPLEYIIEGQSAGTTNVRCINDYTYSTSVRRKIYKRVDIGQWVSMSNGLPVLTDEDWTIEKSMGQGFSDIDGFSEQDMYAVGGNGDIWHYDGETWSQCAFPSNEQTNTVLCAPDGQVYIGSKGCSLWVGREHSWKQVHKDSSTILWNQLRWFQDKL